MLNITEGSVDFRNEINVSRGHIPFKTMCLTEKRMCPSKIQGNFTFVGQGRCTVLGHVGKLIRAGVLCLDRLEILSG